MRKTTQQPTNFADCYVLTRNRTKAFILSFLDTFLPCRQAYTTTYGVPELSEKPTATFASTEALIDYLEAHTNEPYGIYWYNKDPADLQGAMCLFYEEGSLVAGLCCQTLYPDITIEASYTQRLMQFCKSQQACVLYEEPAPRSLAAFQSKPAFTPMKG